MIYSIVALLAAFSLNPLRTTLAHTEPAKDRSKGTTGSLKAQLQELEAVFWPCKCIPNNLSNPRIRIRNQPSKGPGRSFLFWVTSTSDVLNPIDEQDAFGPFHFSADKQDAAAEKTHGLGDKVWSAKVQAPQITKEAYPQAETEVLYSETGDRKIVTVIAGPRKESEHPSELPFAYYQIYRWDNKGSRIAYDVYVNQKGEKQIRVKEVCGDDFGHTASLKLAAADAPMAMPRMPPSTTTDLNEKKKQAADYEKAMTKYTDYLKNIYGTSKDTEMKERRALLERCRFVALK